ncbi:MAG TPA: cytochrome c [Nitrospiria bacterium]|nr:cytochrome c [Nitrospiria bacterium]
MTLRQMSVPVKILFSCFLLTAGMAYIFAILYLYLMDLEPHVKNGKGTVKAVILKYYGNQGGGRLEAALHGPMGDDLSDQEKNRIYRWIREGASEQGFPQVFAILQQNCVSCHDGNMPGIPRLASFEELAGYTKTDMGESIKNLIRVSHVHLFGISFIFLLSGGIFVLSELSVKWRAILVLVPFISMWVDIGSWWFTKLAPVFAYTVIIGGVFMGLSFGAQIAISFYEMWLKKEK